MLSMKLHAQWMGCQPEKIYATGGVSRHEKILQILADVQGCPVIKSSATKSTALGAALIAAYGFFAQSNGAKSWRELTSPFTALKEPPILPNLSTRSVYEELL